MQRAGAHEDANEVDKKSRKPGPSRFWKLFATVRKARNKWLGFVSLNNSRPSREVASLPGGPAQNFQIATCPLQAI